LDESNTKLSPRFSVDQVKAALIDTPVVMVTGPRACGKTTLVRGFTSHRYITLDDDTVLEAARGDPSGFVRGLDQAIVDEVQRAPDLMRANQENHRRRPSSWPLPFDGFGQRAHSTPSLRKP
jgi:uncharacterized protein